MLASVHLERTTLCRREIWFRKPATEIVGEFGAHWH